jgi:zinc protease
MFVHRRLFAVMMLTILTTAALAKEGATPLDPFLAGVRKKTLPNGLTLITRQVPGSGVVAVNTWVKAGYFHEPDEVAGMAHLFEHMFFKGSKKFPGAAQIAEELGSVGGMSNAGTIYDTTNYYFILPKEGFVRALEIQADAIANPLFDAAELKKEAEVVIEESNRKRDTPGPLSQELMLATAFEKHRMKRWRIGSNEVLRNIKRDNLLAFFETLYRPQNMVLVVVGDVTHEEAARAVEKTFGTLSKGKLDKQRGPAEPPQTAFRYGQASADVRQGFANFGWHTPGVGSADNAALSVFSAILGQGRSSRLFRNVIGPNAASNAMAANFTFDDVGMFMIHSSFDEKNRAEVERRILQEVERLKRSGPTAFELQLAKNLTESQTILRLEEVLGQAQALGQAEVNGGYRNLGLDLAKMQAVTADDITRVARKYLTVENLTLHHYRPKGTPEQTREAVLALVQQAVANAPDAQPAETAQMPTAQPLRGATATSKPQQTKLSNGATLIVEERAGAPVVTAGVYFRGGRINENSSNAGITRLMANTMRRGTSTRTVEQINREIEFLGTNIGVSTPLDYFGFTTDVIARNARPAVSLLADVILNPSFPANQLQEEKHLQNAAIKRNADSATARPTQLLYEALYRNHPYALPSDGYVTSVDATSDAALRSWWQQHVTADDAVIVIAGDINAADAKQLAEEAFAKLPKRSGATPVMAALPLVPSGRSDAIEFRDRKQSAIAIGFPAVSYSHPDYVKLRTLEEISSGLSGTLFTELRSRRSLAYSVGGRIDPAGQGGTFIGYLASEASKEPEAVKGLVEELRRLGKDAATEQNLARAKSTMAGVAKLQRQTNIAHVSEAARNHFLGLGLDFTDRMLSEAQKQTLDDIKAAATKYFGSDNYVMAIVRGKS